MKLDIKHDLDKLRREMGIQGKQVPFAAARALTLTAKGVEAATIEEMKTHFDRPTPFMLKGMRTKPAKKNDLEARVFVKDYDIGGHNSFAGGYQSGLANIVGHEFGGGTRQRKLLELRFQQQGLITANEYLVPGAGARLDAYGNISRSQVQQILSQLLMRQAGYENRASGSKRSVRNQKRAGEIFWSTGIKGFASSKGHNGTLSKGVWQRTKGGNSLKPLLVVVGRPHYKQRINLAEITQRVKDRDFDRLFAESFDLAVRTAK